jgi:hypothetical protein
LKNPAGIFINAQTRLTGISPSVECHPEALEALLSRRVPDLQRDVADGTRVGIGDRDLLGEKVGPNCGLVLAGELLGVVSVHEGGFADSGRVVFVAIFDDFRFGVEFL